MEIKRGNNTISDVFLKDSSYVNEEINGEFISFLEFDARNPVNLTINDWIEAFGNRFYVRFKESVSKEETSLGFSYRVKLYHYMYKMYEVAFFLYDTPEFKKHTSKYTGTARQVLELVVKSMNRIYPGWTLGECPDTKTMTFNFQDKKCGEVKDELLRTYEGYEFWVNGTTMNFGKREYSSNGLVLSQGYGLVDLHVEAVDDTPPITRLYAYGGDTNITADKGDYLQLPNGQLYIEKNVDKYGIIEHVQQFPDRFPKGEFRVTAKIDDFTLQSSDIDFNLTDQLIDGVEVVVTFQDGGLAGYDLNIVEGSWNNETKQFKLKQNEDETALKVPGDITFQVGDVFILTSLRMPDSYHDNASEELLEDAGKWLDQKCENRVQVKGPCDEQYFAEQDIYITCGQMVGIYNQKLEINREIRAVKVKRYLENNNEEAFRYDVTFSDFLQGNAWNKVVNDIKDVPNKIEREVDPVKQYTKRSYQDVKETLEMMFDPEGDYFTELIKPLAVHTAEIIVGTNSQQFELIDIFFQPNYQGNANAFRSTAGQLVHFTINGDGTERTWNISAYSTAFSNNNPYYIYAKCDRNGPNGVMLASRDKILLETDPDYYHFWVGVVNSPHTDGTFTYRSWQPKFGYTEISGNQITTGMIKDRNARTVFDLEKGTIDGMITFRAGTVGYDNISDKPDLSGIGTALDEAEAAYWLASSKNKVFYTPTSPTSGMSTNDLWVDGKNIYRYTGSSWVYHSGYDVTETVINGGLITTGAISFGGTGGMAATGEVRIWSGLDSPGSIQPPDNPTFKVLDNGDIYTRGKLYCCDSRGDIVAGIAANNVAGYADFIWAGGSMPSNAPFSINYGGLLKARNAVISKWTFDTEETSALNSKLNMMSAGSGANRIISLNAGYNDGTVPLINVYTTDQNIPLFRGVVASTGEFSIQLVYNAGNRTLIKCNQLVNQNQVGSGNEYPVYFSEASQCLFMKTN